MTIRDVAEKFSVSHRTVEEFLELGKVEKINGKKFNWDDQAFADFSEYLSIFDQLDSYYYYVTIENSKKPEKAAVSLTYKVLKTELAVPPNPGPKETSFLCNWHRAYIACIHYHPELRKRKLTTKSTKRWCVYHPGRQCFKSLNNVAETPGEKDASKFISICRQFNHPCDAWGDARESSQNNYTFYDDNDCRARTYLSFKELADDVPCISLKTR